MTTLKTVEVLSTAPTGFAARRTRTSPATGTMWAMSSTPSVSYTPRWCDVSVPQAAHVIDTNAIAKALVAFAGHGSRRLEEHST